MKCVYVCERCGKTYADEYAAAECEKKHAAYDEQLKKLESEKQKRIQEIDDAREHLRTLRQSFAEDYNTENVLPTFYKMFL